MGDEDYQECDGDCDEEFFSDNFPSRFVRRDQRGLLCLRNIGLVLSLPPTLHHHCQCDNFQTIIIVMVVFVVMVVIAVTVVIVVIFKSSSGWCPVEDDQNLSLTAPVLR